MIEFQNTVVVISASLAGRKMPGLPMLDVNGGPLVVRALERAEAALLGKVLVVSPENRVAEAVRAAGHDALASPPSAVSPSDQAAAVLKMRDPARQFTSVLVYPAELAAIPALDLRRCLAGLTNKDVDLATLAAPADKGRNKVIAPLSAEREVAYLRGLSPLTDQDQAAFQHVPVIAWRREALEKFASLRPQPREKDLASELPRALEAGLRCAVVKVDSAPLSVDTPAELDALRRLLKV